MSFFITTNNKANIVMDINIVSSIYRKTWKIKIIFVIKYKSTYNSLFILFVKIKKAFDRVITKIVLKLNFMCISINTD